MKKAFILIIVVLLLTLGITLAVSYLAQQKSPKITFEACEAAGGVAWLVDLNHPDICPSCAEYQACEAKYNDYSELCPDCYGPCLECQDKYSVYASCPACYGPCQTCQNKYLNDFESVDERYKLCPDCETCDYCRIDIESKKANCPPCLSCNDCQEANRKYRDIRDVCPQITPCVECMERNSPYPNSCPDGRDKIGEISDAAMWFQCCK